MLRILAAATAATGALAAHSVDDFGAIIGDDGNDAAWANTAAVKAALLAANASATDRTAVVPADSDYWIFNVEVEDLHDVTFQLDGTLHLSENRTAWPQSSDFGDLAALSFKDSSQFSFVGSGEVDGHGWGWWWDTILTGEDHRPLLVKFQSMTDLLLEGDLLFKNSPFWHVKASSVVGYTVRGVQIWVDVEKQKAMLEEAGLLKYTREGLPIVSAPAHAAPAGTRPLTDAEALDAVASPGSLDAINWAGPWALNTDGLDIAAKDVLVEDTNINCWDDSYAIKPLNGGSDLADCAENVVVRDSVTTWGVGLTIGSVGPSADTACVRNVTFENVVSHHPLKGIYIKPNPGDSGDGVIDSITYRNVTLVNSVWFPIYVGTQQQQQPGTSGTGCSWLYPLAGTCVANERVTLSNIVLEDVAMTGSLLWPGVLMANETNPGVGFSFTNVTNEGEFLLQDYYTVENVRGVSEGEVAPEVPWS